MINFVFFILQKYQLFNNPNLYKHVLPIVREADKI